MMSLNRTIEYLQSVPILTILLLLYAKAFHFYSNSFTVIFAISQAQFINIGRRLMFPRWRMKKQFRR